MELNPHWPDAAVTYRPKRDGTLAQFKKSGQATTLRQQTRVNVDRLQKFLNDHEPPERHAHEKEWLNTFARNVEQAEAGPYSTETAKVYSVKGDLDGFVARLQNDRLLVNERLARVKNLAQSIQFCVGGVSSSIQIANQSLALKLGRLTDQAKATWLAALDQQLQQFAASRYGHLPHFEGNEVHYVNGYRNALAEAYGALEVLDNAVPPEIGETLADCEAYVAARMTPSLLVHTMADACLQSVQNHFTAYCNKPLPPLPAGSTEERTPRPRIGEPMSADQIYAAIDHFNKTLLSQLEFCYGKIDIHTLFERHAPAGSDDAVYTLIDNPTMLVHAIAKNLRAAGVLAPFKTQVVLGNPREEAQVIKQVDDETFYVKAQRTGRTLFNRRPVRVGDFPPEADSPALLAAALANTYDAEQLALLHPSRVWALLQANSQPLGWLQQLSEPAVRRWRQADPRDESELLDLAFHRFLLLQQPQREEALRLVLSNAEGDFGQRLVTKVDHVNATDAAGNTALHLAAGAGLTLAVQRLIRKTDDIDLPNAQGLTPLLWAADKGHAAAAKALVEAAPGVIYTQNDQGLTALALAASHGHADVVTALLHARVAPDVNARDAARLTPLMWSAYDGSVAILDALLMKNASVGLADSNGKTALSWAATGGHADAIKRLLRAGAAINHCDGEGNTPLMQAAASGSPTAVQALLDADPPPSLEKADDYGFTAALSAAESGHAAVIQQLNAAGANLTGTTHEGDNALMLAAHGRHVAVIETLLKIKKIDVNAVGKSEKTALMAAAQGGCSKAIALLQAAGARVEQQDDQGFTALMVAAYCNEADAIDALVEVGARLNKTNRAGLTALMWAADQGQADALTRLLAAGADPNVKTGSGLNALMLAASSGQVAIIEVLTRSKAGVSVDQTSDGGWTALMQAARKGHVGAIEALVAAKVTVDLKNESGRTALSEAAAEGHVAAIEALIEAEADVNTQDDKEACSPLEHAAAAGHADAMKALLQHGADWGRDGARVCVMAKQHGQEAALKTVMDELKLASPGSYRFALQYGKR